MAKEGKPKKAKHIGRPSKIQSERLRESIFQDLCAGFPILEIASRNKCERSVVDRLQVERRDDIRERIRLQLEDRQRRIDQFLKDEQKSMIEICEESSAMLKEAIQRHKEKLQSNKVVTKEVKHKTEDGKWHKGISPDDLEMLTSVWERVHAMFARVQGSANG